MKKILSRDGTAIAFDQAGKGPALILVLGAFNERASGASLAARLSERFTVFNYDRRARGASGDASTYAIEREIEVIAALIHEAGGSASVFGYSSGALLALMAAERGLSITKLALYEPPFLLLSRGERGAAVELYQTEVVGIPAEIVAQLRDTPFRPALEAIAQSLVYDATILGKMDLLAQRFDYISVPTLLVSGEASPTILGDAAQAITDALPHAHHRRLTGQTHDINALILAPVLETLLIGEAEERT